MTRQTTKLAMLAGLLTASALTGCSDPAEAPRADPEVTAQNDEQMMPVEPDGGIGDGATPLPEATASASANPTSGETAAMTIPQPVRGKWREVPMAEAGDKPVTSVTAAQCNGNRQPNFGKVLTIRADGFSFFETGGRLIKVNERDASRIDATYDTTYADTPTQGRYIFDAQDGGKVLILRETGADARPGPIRYLRCPA